MKSPDSPDVLENTVLEFFEQVYLPLRLSARSHNTVRLYRYTVRKFNQWLEREATLADFDDHCLSSYLMHLRTTDLSIHSVEKERSQLLAIWNFAARKGYVKLFPDVPRGKLPKRIPRAWTIDDLRKILQACLDTPGMIETGGNQAVAASDWWYALHLVVYDTAERIGALMQLQWDHLLPDGWLLIPAEFRKGKNEDRQFLLSPETLLALRKIKRSQADRIFPWPMSETYLWRRYKAVLKRAGLPHDGKCMFHRLRRTVASHFKLAGGDATQLLGHSKSETTAAYIDPRIVKPPQPSEVLTRIGPDRYTCQSCGFFTTPLRQSIPLCPVCNIRLSAGWNDDQ